MAVYTHTISKSNPEEYSLLDKSSGAWTNYNRLWDNDIGTLPSNTDSGIHIKINMDWLPNNMKLTKVNYGIVYKRTSQSAKNIWLGATDYSTVQPDDKKEYEVKLSLPLGTYNNKEWHYNSYIFEDGESEEFLKRKNQYLGLNKEIYEIFLEFEYTEKNSLQVYVGPTQSSEIYIGDKKASAIYVGTTQVL